MDPQVGINVLVSTAVYVLAGLSFFLPFSTSRFFHFTHGAALVLGAYTALALGRLLELPLLPSVLLGVGAAALFGGTMEIGLYRPLRNRSATPFLLLLASLGAYIAVQNALSLCFGDAAQSIAGSRHWGVFSIGPTRITQAQTAQVVCAVLAAAVMALLARKTLVGLRMNAVGDNPELARHLGFDTDALMGLSFVIGYGLAGLTGILMACSVDATPLMGMRPMMMGMVAMIIGGDTLAGTVCGAALLGTAQNVAVVWLPAQWQDAIAFMILLVFLIFRPQGLFGYAGRPVSV